MIDNTMLSTLTSRLGPQERHTFDQSRSAQQRAAVTDFSSSTEEQIARTRLDRFLSSDQPPRDDVPRGYYFDIVV